MNDPKINVKKIAQLARLQINEADEAKCQQQMESILNYFNEVSAVNTEGVEPLVTPVDIELVFRQDEKKESISVEEALQNAPERSGHLFKVPPVV